MRSSTFTTRLRIAAIAAGAFLAAGLVIVALQSQSGEASRRARLQALAAAEDAALPTMLRSWADEDGDVTFVIEQLGDDRTAVAQAAGRVIDEQLTAWQSLRSEVSSPKIAELAKALAHRREHFSPSGQRVASALAQRMLVWPLDDRRVDVFAVYVDCDALLRAASERPHELLLTAANNRSPGAAGMMIGRHEPSDASDHDASEAASLPGGGLPWDAVDVPLDETPPMPEAFSPTSLPNSPEPRSFDTPGEIYAPLATPLDLLEGKERTDDRTASHRRPAGRPTGSASRLAGLPLDERDDWALMKLLHDGDAGPAAEDELRRRGFTTQSLELARHMTDPRAAVRRELAESLPQIPHIDPQPWLLQLAADVDPQVRRTAISMIASSNEASVTHWLELLRKDERDPRVAAAIDELLRRR